MPFDFSENFDVKKAWTLDQRSLCQDYDRLLEFNSDNYIPLGFPVAVFDADPDLRGVYLCLNPADLANPLSWEKVGGNATFEPLNPDLFNGQTEITFAEAINQLGSLLSAVPISYPGAIDKMDAGTLVPFAWYQIDGETRPSNSLGSTGDILIQASSASSFKIDGFQLAWVPDYNTYPEWHADIASYSYFEQPDYTNKVIHSNCTWQFVPGGFSTIAPGQDGSWILNPAGHSATGNTKQETDPIEYDIVNDWITRRRDSRNNDISCSRTLALDQGVTYSPVDVFKWGCDKFHDNVFPQTLLHATFMNWKASDVRGNKLSYSLIESTELEYFGFYNNIIERFSLSNCSGYNHRISDNTGSGFEVYDISAGSNVIIADCHCIKGTITGIGALASSTQIFNVKLYQAGLYLNSVTGSNIGFAFMEIHDGGYAPIATSTTQGSTNVTIRHSLVSNVRGAVNGLRIEGQDVNFNTVLGTGFYSVSGRVSMPGYNTLPGNLTLAGSNFNNTTKTLTIPSSHYGVGHLYLDATVNFGGAVTIRKIIAPATMGQLRIYAKGASTITLENSANLVLSGSTSVASGSAWVQLLRDHLNDTIFIQENSVVSGGGGGGLSAEKDSIPFNTAADIMVIWGYEGPCTIADNLPAQISSIAYQVRLDSDAPWTTPGTGLLSDVNDWIALNVTNPDTAFDVKRVPTPASGVTPRACFIMSTRTPISE